MKILIVDDDEFARELLTCQLTVLGASAVECFDRGSEALQALNEGHDVTDLVFCDLQMPEMDGVEFVRQLAAIGYRGGLVLVSGQDLRILQAAERLAEAHELNVRGALHKPVTSNTLREVLREKNHPATTKTARRHKTYSAEDLEQAIGNGDLLVHYQPQVDIRSAEVVGVEALVRWQHPEDGLVYPDQFIHVAEARGLIGRLTDAVLQASLRDARSWRDEGLQLQVSVNVSMANLTDLDFPDRVERLAADVRIPVQSLMLEVTESRLMKDPSAALDVLTRFRIKRISLSIDDFGTGHASLAQLRDIPFNELKVDRGFIHGASRDASLQAIVEASLRMARQLGMKVVAEGVEERDDWRYLHTIGCDRAQGWFIARPMLAGALPAWIADWKNRRVDASE